MNPENWIDLAVAIYAAGTLLSIQKYLVSMATRAVQVRAMRALQRAQQREARKGA